MVNVLVIGAGGYIGNAVAISVRRAGHKVWGLVRKADQAEQLKLNEIIPVIGDINDSKSYESIFDLVSHIIDTTGVASGPGGAILQDAVLLYGKKSGRKLTFIYTAGISTPGPQRDGLLINEDIHKSWDTTRHPFFLSIVAAEEKVLISEQLTGVVIRAGWVFGGHGGNLLDSFWSYDNKTGDYEYKGNIDKIWSWIHVNDLANVYVKVIEAPSAIVSHQIFNAVNDNRVKVSDIRTAMARVAGATGKLINVAADMDPLSQLMENNWMVSNNKVKRVLNWTPKFDLFDEVSTYYQSWKAAKAAKKA